jgi:hypothetical protein
MNDRPFSNHDTIAEIASVILNEAVATVIVDDDSLMKAVRKILPTSDTTSISGYLSWSKRGGYAGEKMVDRIKERLIAIGFKKDTVGGNNTPDGSYFGFSERLVQKKLGWEALLRKSYGPSASSNSYTATVKKIKVA